jgi:hypothetical protein
MPKIDKLTAFISLESTLKVLLSDVKIVRLFERRFFESRTLFFENMDSDLVSSRSAD